MLVNAVILILREVLEVALVISLLLAATRPLGLDYRWLLKGLCAGAIGATVIAVYMAEISEAWEGVGQELVNAALLAGIGLLLGVLAVRIYARFYRQQGIGKYSHLDPLVFSVTAALSIAREGSEIVIYGSAFSANMEIFAPVLTGGAIGAGIGASLGALLYCGLIVMPVRLLCRVSIVILVLMAANLVSESSLYLIQAGWLPSYLPLWDWSSVLSPSSVTGQLLHAMVGYQANPTAIQVGTYVCVVAGIVTILLYMRKDRTRV